MLTVVEVGAAELTSAHPRSIGFPDCLFDCNGVCNGCSDDCKPSGDWLWTSDDTEQSASLRDFHCMEK